MKGISFNRRKFLAVAGFGPIAAVVDAVAVEPEWVRVETVRLADKPRCRLAQITDIHHKGDRPYLEKVVRLANEQKPDFVCFTGDLIEEAHHAAEALEVLEGIEAPLFGIPGNHDHWADMDFDRARESFGRSGGQWLMDETVIAHDGVVRLFGLSGLNFCDFAPKPGQMNILMSHYPSGVELYPDTRFDLVLAGHSHGGQVRLPGYGSLIVPFGVGEYQVGLYETPAGPLYVNPGIGWFFANVRFFCRPEITVIEL